MGPCLVTYDTARAVGQREDGGAVAYRPVCGDPACLPIAFAGHPGPNGAPPSSTCDRPSAQATAQCGVAPTCACLLPLLNSAVVWSYSQWNCYWFCSDASDGGVDLLHCDPP
jgi:hypothetical protein